jgi:hypothetical protein
MPCALCGDIIPTEVDRCPACGAWARRRNFRALGLAVFLLLGFNAFMALGSGVGLARMFGPLAASTSDSYDARATTRLLTAYADVFAVAGALALLTGMLFLGWLWRAHRQAGAARRYRTGWVVVGWLFPVVNLWLPPRLIHDVWVGSAPHRRADRHRAGVIVAAWWISLLSAVGLAQLFRAGGMETLADARLAAQIGLAGAAAQALAATLCMAIVFQITRLQFGLGKA